MKNDDLEKMNIEVCREKEDFKFREMSVAYHFAEIATGDLVSNMQDRTCEILGSYEFDLFLYRFQEKPPYRTFCLTGSGKIPCTVRFPESIIYISEGRKVRLEGNRNNVDFGVAIHCTFFNNGTRIWSMVFSPQDDVLISQDEVIKLINLFCLSREQKDLPGDTSFETPFYKGNSFAEMAGSLAGKVASLDPGLFSTKPGGLTLINSGIVQLEIMNNPENSEKSQSWETVISLIDRMTRKDTVALAQLEESYKNYRETMEIVNLMCGISLGIFDYSRMSFDEVTDTLRPISGNKDSVQLLNKGILTSIGCRKEGVSSARSAIGIDPYLLISSTVLAFDDCKSAYAENKLDNILDKVTDEKKATPGLEELINDRKELQRIVNDEILTNVFHYPTERITLEHGLSHRGIKDRIQNIRNRLTELNSVINDQVERDNKRNKIIVALLLAAISILGLEAFFGRIYSSIQSYGGFSGMWEKEGPKWMIFLPFAAVIFFVITYFTIRDLKKKG